jgi:hypothetical protein
VLAATGVAAADRLDTTMGSPRKRRYANGEGTELSRPYPSQLANLRLGECVSADVERGCESQNGIRRGDTEGDSLTFSRQPLQITCARIALE